MTLCLASLPISYDEQENIHYRPNYGISGKCNLIWHFDFLDSWKGLGTNQNIVTLMQITMWCYGRKIQMCNVGE